ncbi:MAG TPA: glutamine amidotransferase [Symbiobacteriaceae bacterium]|nr:glutamine amidotransferase [Symbiobacteriaceae bacterium]
MGISFSHPWALLALLPALGWFGWEWYRRRWRIFGWMRLVIVLLLILALAGTGVVFSARNQAVMFIADVSASTAAIRPQMEEFVKSAVSQIPAGDVAGVLTMAENAVLEAPVAPRPTFSGFTSVVNPDHTDLEKGLRLGAALLPTGYRPRLVLLSDGRENVGNAMAEVQRLRQRGFTVDVVNFAPANPGPEALIKSIEAPGATRLGERVDLTMTLTSTTSGPAKLRIYEDRTLLETRSINLTPGDSQVRVSMENLTPGYHRLWATLEADKDSLTQNNEAAVMVNVQGAPSVLLVEGFAGSGTNLATALKATGMSVEVRTPDALPTHGPQLARYASVILVDVPAPLISAASMEALNGYVKQGGKGLVVVGGENSYAMGGYGGTKLEELLPLNMDVPQRKEKPPVAVALIFENFESNEKINVSKEAAKALVDMLTPRDSIVVGDACIVGGWLVPAQKVTDKAKIKEMIDAAAPCDPPHYMDHLEAAAEELKGIDAKIKHIVFAGDGDAQMISMGEYASRVAKIASAGITLSTIHVNYMRPEERVLLELMARTGNGRYYLANNVNATPQIFLKEAQTMARPGVVEEDFFPAVLSRSPVLQGLTDLPMLRGYVATTPKPAGEVVLQSAQADPVLATWQAGLGRVAAFTSDTGGLWSADMVRWQDFQRFWSNIVTWTMPAVEETGMRTMASVVGGKAHMTVQLPGEGLAVGGVGGENSWPANITAGVIRPDGSTQILPLQATAPGQYEGEIPASMPGPYLVKLSAGTQRQSVQLGETFLVAPYSPEFATGAVDPAFMQRLAKSGGGSVLDDPKAAFARNLPMAPGRLPLDHALLVLALLLWPVDIAMRRLAITPLEVAAALKRRRERQALGPATAAGAAVQKMRERRAERNVPPAAQPSPPRQAPNASTTPTATAARPAAPPNPPAEAQPAATKEPEPRQDGLFTQRLLDARRKKK